VSETPARYDAPKTWQQRYAEHKAMLAALDAGIATPEQQRAAHAHLLTVERQRSAAMLALHAAGKAYSDGRFDAQRDARDDPPGTY
jgi:hypothetical protein